MNYPMNDGQIDPEFVEKVFQKADNIFAHYDQSEVEQILLAAQEVMQEMDKGLKIGDRVVRPIGINGEGTISFMRERVFEVDFDNGKSGIYSESSLLKIEEAQHGEG